MGQKILIVKSKSSGFSKLSNKTSMEVPVTEIVELEKGKHYDMIVSILPSSQKKFYDVTIPSIVGPLYKVTLTRKSLDISGPIRLNVVLIKHDKSYDEIQEEKKDLAVQYERAMKIFGTDRKKVSLEELGAEVSELSKKKFVKVQKFKDKGRFEF